MGRRSRTVERYLALIQDEAIPFERRARKPLMTCGKGQVFLTLLEEELRVLRETRTIAGLRICQDCGLRPRF